MVQAQASHVRFSSSSSSSTSSSSSSLPVQFRSSTPTKTTSTAARNLNSKSTILQDSHSQSHPPSDYRPGSVLDQLHRTFELQRRVSLENSKTMKQLIIREYPDLRDLLEHIYDPEFRAHMTSASLIKYTLADGSGSGGPDPDQELDPGSASGSSSELSSSSSRSKQNSVPQSLTELFETLQSRKETGNAAKELVLRFLDVHGVRLQSGKEEPDGEEAGQTRTELIDTFWRLLDRNLVAGFGANTLKNISWGSESGSGSGSGSTSSPTSPSTSESISTSSLEASLSSPSADSALSSSSKSSTALAANQSDFPPITQSKKPQSQPQSQPLPQLQQKSNESRHRQLTKFTCALGKTILPQDLSKLFKPPKTEWYASRKLDGVRCLVLVDFVVGVSPPSTASTANDNNDNRALLELYDIKTVSREGNEFTSLEVLKDALKGLGGMSDLIRWLNSDPEIIEDLGNGKVVKRIVLDGEVCVMRPRTADERIVIVNDSESDSESDGDRNGDLDAASSLWKETDWIEDFPSTVSLIKRKNDQIPHPILYLLDVLSWAELSGQKGSTTIPGLGKSFAERVQDSKAVVEYLGGDVIRRLEQRVVNCVEEVEGMIDRAAREGWEGLVLRADKPYQGGRSTSIRKFKQWQDDEYVVKSIDTSTMRLAVNGIFGEHEACSNLWIEHKGHPVSVGSGFTAEQRLRYAKDPSEIVGKQVTIEYFNESTAVGRDQPSLRFPRIKKIWEEGLRDV